MKAPIRIETLIETRIETKVKIKTGVDEANRTQEDPEGPELGDR